MIRRKWLVLALLAVVLGGSFIGLARRHGHQRQQAALSSETDKRSYSMGVSISRSFKGQQITLDADTLARGFRDGLSGEQLLMTDDEMRQVMSRLQIDLKQRKAPAPTGSADESKKAGDAFLAENATKKGVVRRPSGLQYLVLRTGTGPAPTAGDQVELHYRTLRIDGTELASSYSRGPATFQMADLIAGWREALQLMPVGSKWKLFVPSELAYGARRVRGRKRTGLEIPPNTALVFELELLAINPEPAGERFSAAAVTPGRGK